MRIDAQYDNFPADTFASIYTAGLRGEQYIALEPGGSEEMPGQMGLYANDDTVCSGVGAGNRTSNGIIKRMKKILKFVLIAALLLTGSLVVAEENIPLLIVQDTSTRMLASLKAEKEAIRNDPGRLQALVSEIVSPYFDFQRMSQWVLGRAWVSASDVQREHFVSEFSTLLMRTYGRALAEYSDEKIIYLPFTYEDGSKKAQVRTEIVQPGVAPIPVSYSMYLRDGEWKVYDVSIDGVSLVLNYRSTFGRVIKNEGLDVLIEQLASHNSGQA